AWDAENEISTPYYYSVWLEDYDITLEFTPSAKSGYFRIKFPQNASKHVLLQTMQSGGWKQLDQNTMTGVEQFQGMKAFVYGQFNQPFDFTAAAPNKDRQNGIVSWSQNTPAVIEFKYAISFISDAQAKKNFESEIKKPSFETVKEEAYRAWSKVLNQIQVEGGTEANRRTFYTAFYRCYERMVDITEDGTYYSNYDKQVHKADRPFYVDDWIWDTYLAHHPLRTLLNPVQEADMLSSYVRMYEQSGWLPTFPVLWGDNPCMNGFHSTITILDAYRKGITDFDVATAYEAMKKNAMEATMLPWRNGPACSLDRFYAEKGYYPALAPGQAETETRVDRFEKRQSVAITLGHSYDDWALAQFAEELGHHDDALFFARRATNYKNLYWKEKGFFMPKDDQGHWIDIDPKFDGGMGGRDYYDENNGWTYLWQVQHDVPGLMALMGGKDAFEKRLDQLFREDLGRSKYELWARFPDFTGIVGQYSMGNEPSFHIPYLYNFTDSPWKTQKKIRMLMNTWFPDSIFGIPGDEDGGGMSAFVVFSSMGFYPVTPGLPLYTIGSPVFEKVTINLPNGKTFIVSAPGCSETNKYIHQAFLNGMPLEGPWFTHADLVNGGELKLVMGQKPNTSWGINSSLLPTDHK
ncbi:MAG: GH92 family glycosyl hydrolase, partial [Sedimentisphaerales bacterium]|nr:GH92 family glycosyl hydrolase [Sedimentisphaerales bacterium]